jgi:hypothetical protein
LAKSTFEAPEKITIIAGPSFGQALKFMVFGAVVGAGAAYYKLQSKDGGSGSKSAGLKSVAGKYEATVEDFTAGGKPVLDALHTSSGADVADKISSLTSRLKNLGSRAKDLVESAGEAVKPTLETAIAEGKRAAAEVQNKLKKDVDEAGDKPAIAEQDGELPSEKEDKFVE